MVVLVAEGYGSAVAIEHEYTHWADPPHEL